MRLGLNLGLSTKASGSGGAADPYASLLALFASSEAGEVWIAHPDYFFTDTACTTPVSAVGDEVQGWLGAKYGTKFTQSTAGAIPKYARQPPGGWKQRLLQTGNLTSATWVKTNTTVTGGQADPDGGGNAFRITSTASGALNKCSQDVLYRNGNTNTLSLKAKAGNVNRIAISLERSSGAYADLVFDLSTGSWITTSGAATNSETDLGGGWWLIEVHHASARDTAEHWFGPINSAGANVFDTTTGNYIDVYQPQLEEAATATAYEERGSATDGPASGDSVACLYFDGDDRMVSSAIDFTGTDKITVATVWDKVRINNDYSMVVELSNDTTANNGSFFISDNGGGASDLNYLMGIRGTSTLERYMNASQPPYDRSVVAVVFDLAGSATTAITPRVTEDTGAGTLNTAMTTSSGTGTGGGNFGNHALNIGRRGSGGTAPSTGYMAGALVVLGRAATGGEITSIESVLAGVA